MKIAMKIAFLCLFLIIGTVTARDKKNCFCQAVDATSSNVIHDWGSIRTHTHWISVSCRRLRGCKNDCNTHVKNWVKSNPAKCDGMKIRSRFDASNSLSYIYAEIRDENDQAPHFGLLGFKKILKAVDF
ncbi:hypothetical protein KUTeg_021407 [Tegillarca granosa]|uniref:Lysozyme n=1 Tax=Tegillarca granosa TaxID=220873 RepID=A0ABQ9E363_TEGGR|nr:hypothetical protein KUTeg_021407 [Tegillarca granosa]